MEFSEEINQPSTLTEDWNDPLTEEWVNSEYGQNLLTQLQAKMNSLLNNNNAINRT
ncbi:MAG: hypothetical protein ACYTX0_42090 [Nostoc sp.]